MGNRDLDACGNNLLIMTTTRDYASNHGDQIMSMVIVSD